MVSVETLFAGGGGSGAVVWVPSDFVVGGGGGASVCVLAEFVGGGGGGAFRRHSSNPRIV